MEAPCENIGYSDQPSFNYCSVNNGNDDEFTRPQSHQSKAPFASALQGELHALQIKGERGAERR